VTRDASEVFRPLFEALNWFDSIDERARIGERHVRAIRYARRRVHHQWADAVYPHTYPVSNSVQVAPGVSLTLSGFGLEWRWRAAANLPPAPANFKDPKGESMYAQLLSDRAVLPALEAVERYLKRRFP